MFDIALRDVKEAVCAPVARVLGRVFTPTQVTVLGFFCGLMSVLFVSWGWFVAGNVCWYLNRFLDGVDGVVARLQNKQSDFGGYVDILCDFVVYALVPIALCVALTDALAPLDAVALVQRDSIVHTLLPDLVPRDISMRSLFVILALLESTYFVNAASQMFLASILEKRAQGAKANGTQPARLQACVCARALARWLTATTTWRSALGGAAQGSSRRSRCQ